MKLIRIFKRVKKESSAYQKYMETGVFDPKKRIILVVNKPTIVGYRIVEEYGTVFSSSSPSKNMLRDWMANIRSMVGKEVVESNKMIMDARDKAMRRLEFDAIKLGGNAIVNLRFGTSNIMEGSAEFVLYGSAVKVIKNA